MVMQKGQIKSFKRGRKTTYTNQVIVYLDGMNDKSKALALKGRKAQWTNSSGKARIGVVMDAHGDKGAIRVRFEKPLPPSSIGSKIFVK